MSKPINKVLVIISLLVGGLLWYFITVTSGENEAWDSALYFTIGVPLLTVLSFILGMLNQNKHWIWGVTFSISQIIVMLIIQGKIDPLIIIGLFFHALLCSFYIIISYVGVRFNKNKKALQVNI